MGFTLQSIKYVAHTTCTFQAQLLRIAHVSAEPRNCNWGNVTLEHAMNIPTQGLRHSTALSVELHQRKNTTQGSVNDCVCSPGTHFQHQQDVADCIWNDVYVMLVRFLLQAIQWCMYLGSLFLSSWNLRSCTACTNKPSHFRLGTCHHLGILSGFPW